jgi:hypothetical protein
MGGKMSRTIGSMILTGALLLAPTLGHAQIFELPCENEQAPGELGKTVSDACEKATAANAVVVRF